MDVEPRWLTAEESRTWRAMLNAQSLLMGVLDRELLEEHGHGLPDFDVLVQLSEAPDRSLRMTDLAKAVLLSPSGLTRRLDRLVKSGFVERRPCPSDGRGLLAVLTDEGMDKLVQMAPTQLRGVRQYFIDRVEPQQLGVLATVFENLVEAHRSGDEDGITDADLVTL